MQARTNPGPRHSEAGAFTVQLSSTNQPPGAPGERRLMRRVRCKFLATLPAESPTDLRLGLESAIGAYVADHRSFVDSGELAPQTCASLDGTPILGTGTHR